MQMYEECANACQVDAPSRLCFCRMPPTVENTTLQPKQPFDNRPNVTLLGKARNASVPQCAPAQQQQPEHLRTDQQRNANLALTHQFESLPELPWQQTDNHARAQTIMPKQPAGDYARAQTIMPGQHTDELQPDSNAHISHISVQLSSITLRCQLRCGSTHATLLLLLLVLYAAASRIPAAVNIQHLHTTHS
jgi:hypothetical protein